MGYQACLNCFSPLTGGAVCPRCGFDNAAYRPQPHHLPPGVILQNRYVVGRAMGQGGFGITYVGFNTNLDRRVAIKEYFPDGTAIREVSWTTFVSCTTSVSAKERYHAGLQKCANEAKSLAQLDDIPGIVRVMEHFQENNTVYIIMEFVEGVTLVSWLKQLQKRPGYREALSLLSPIGVALAKIHARGFVHRDVSPDNIMIDREGAVKLLDFGAVKTVTEGGVTTESPVIKRGFSPLEMYSTGGRIGPWSDVYAYCATLCYILTGKSVPEPMNRMEQDALGESLSRIVSPAQSAALLKGLAVAPDQRYQTVTEMTDALSACAEDAASAQQPEAKPEKTAAGPARGTEPFKAYVLEPPEAGLSKKRIAETMARTEPAKRSDAVAGSHARLAREGTDRSAQKREATASAGAGTDQPGVRNKKKRTAVIAAAVTVLAVLCIVIGVAVHLSDQDAFTPLKSADVGDYVIFGTYEQDNQTADGKENIEWLVLAKENGMALLISRYGLDCQPYHSEREDVTWETCSLRAWLNGMFLDDAFSSEEREKIRRVTVTADTEPGADALTDDDTTDQIFLLSITEANGYFGSNNDRKCVPTAYAVARGAYASDTYSIGNNGCSWWWLRSPGDGSCSASGVGVGGGVGSGGDYVDGVGGVVRPALWIDLTA